MAVLHDKQFVEEVKKELETKLEGKKELTDEEKWRLAHAKMHEKHHGHETMHAEMGFILLVVMIVAQIVLVQWRKRYFKSYQMATLFIMWAVPFSISVRNGFMRFVIFWIIFTVITAIVYRKSMERPLSRTTPRLVYKWFYLLYKISYALGVVGHILVIGTLFGVNILFNVNMSVTLHSAVLCFFYSLYYGVLGRDIAEIASDKMAVCIGYYTTEGIPTRQLDHNICAVCGNRILVDPSEPGVIENTYKLTCGHLFHEFCIRGWCIVGKKQTCPYCKEKVDLKRMFPNPWERPHIMYAQLLNWVRWLMAWQPCIFFIVSGLNWVLGLE